MLAALDMLVEWGAWNGSDLPKGFGRGGEPPTILCSDSEIEAVDRVLARMGQSKPFTLYVCKRAFCSPEIDDNSRPILRLDSEIASRVRRVRKLTNTEVANEINIAIRYLDDNL